MRILVTGTSGGIGGAFKRIAEQAGHDIVEINRADFNSLDEACGNECFDAVLFATGTCPVKPLTAMDDDFLCETFAVNCALFARLMRHIVSAKLHSSNAMKAIAISSVSANEGWAGGIAYCASKGALSAMCRAMDAELKAKKISVKAVEPRYIKTRMFDSCAGRMGVDSALARDPEDFARELLAEFVKKEG